MPSIRIYPPDASASTLEVFLETTSVAAPSHMLVAVRIESAGAGLPVSATLQCSGAVLLTIPAELLVGPPGGVLRFATAAEIAAGFEQARQNLLDALTAGFGIQADGAAGTFFGVAAATLVATLVVTPRALGPGVPDPAASVLRATVRGTFGFASLWGAGSAELAIVVEVVNGDITALLNAVSAAQPDFSFALPEFSLPQLKIEAPDLSCDFRFPRLGGPDLGIEFSWVSVPRVSVQLTQSVLVIQHTAEGTGTFKFQGTDIADLQGATIDFDGTNLSFDGRIEARSFSEQFTTGPLRIRLLNLELAAAAGATPEVVLTIGRLEICAAVDDTLFFALTLKVHFPVGRDLYISDTSLLYPTALVIQNLITGTVADGATDLIRLFGSMPITGALVDARLVLRQLTRLAEAIAQWLVRDADLLVMLLAGVVEGVFGIIRDFMGFLEQYGPGSFDDFALEIRLHPQTLQLCDVILIPLGETPLNFPAVLSSAGFELTSPFAGNPVVVFHVATHPGGGVPWAGIVYRPVAGQTALTLDTDLWLTGEAGLRPLRVLDPGTGAAAKTGRLLRISAQVGNVQDSGFVPFALTRNGIRAMQLVGQLANQTYGPYVELRLGGLSELRDLDATAANVTIAFDTSGWQDKLLSLLPKIGTGKSAEFLGRLTQYVQIRPNSQAPLLTRPDGTTYFNIQLEVEIRIGGDAGLLTAIQIEFDYHSFTARLTSSGQILIRSDTPLDTTLFGLTMVVSPGTDSGCFVLDVEHENLSLAPAARAEISFPALSGNVGRGLVLELSYFNVGPAGVDLDAKATIEPVRLGGVDVPVQFGGGVVSVRNSKFDNLTLTAAAPLPRELIGDAGTQIALTLGLDDNQNIVIQSCTAVLTTSGDHIVCESTQFRFTITEIGFMFPGDPKFVAQHGYHFYFTISGTARCLLDSGLTGSLKDIEIVLNKVPLARDGRVLLDAISFLRDHTPAKKGSLFGLFEYEVRAFAFYPSSGKFDGKPPAIGVAGQVKFTAASDVAVPKIDFHEMQIAPPKAGSSLPRVRFDGLTVGLKIGDLAEVEGTAIAVDGSLPSLYRPASLPADILADGFLARGRLSIKGWASMTASMGFLELRDPQNAKNPAKHSMFFYMQENELSEPIPTPIGNIYLREVGFGLGLGYTLRGIAEAAKTTSPQALVKVLDDISRYQGNLDTFEAWAPTYDNDDLTLAMRAMFSLTSASTRGSYNRSGEKSLPNPLLADIVAALRMDGTFLMTIRAFLCYNYEDWNSGGQASFKTHPLLRGYLYLSVPRREFLARFLSDPAGEIGDHPPLPGVLKDALKAVRFQAALYIRPGLFHMELGWPFGLGFDLGKPEDNFNLSLRAGLVTRYEDGGILYGIAFRAAGRAKIEGKIGGEMLGASASAEVKFAVSGKFLSYLSIRIGSSMLYGAFQLDVTISVTIAAWLRIKIFGATIGFELKFEFSLSISVALEVAILLDSGLAAKVFASVGIRVFGRTLAVGVGFTIGADVLTEARSRVARFMALGLSTDVPSETAVAKPPVPEPPRIMRSEIADRRAMAEAQLVPAQPIEPVDVDKALPPGEAISASDFWVIVLPTMCSGDAGYVLQFVPRDHQAQGGTNPDSEFYAPPPVFYLRNGAPAPAVDYADYQITGPNLHLLRQLKTNRGDAPLVPQPAAPLPAPVSTVLLAASHTDIIMEQGGKSVEVGDLLASVFWPPPRDAAGALLGPNEFREPRPFLLRESTVLPAEAEEAAQLLHQASLSRRGLPWAERCAMELFESRSSLIGHVADSAAAIAKAGCTDNVWSALPDNKAGMLDARHLGLTFFVAEPDFDTLFQPAQDGLPRLATFSLVKRKTENPLDFFAPAESTVCAFNPPERMFKNARPLFKFPSEPEFLAGTGIVFDWDLEPRWGRSQSVYDDPEFHLREYRVRREITVGDTRWSVTLKPKAGHVIRYEVDALYLHRPAYQLIDNFSPDKEVDSRIESAGRRVHTISPLVRQLLLHDELDHKLWDAEIGPDDVKVRYIIIPIDIAGTEGLQKETEITIPKPVLRLPAPIDARLSVSYQTDFPALDTAASVKFGMLIHLSRQKGEAPSRDAAFTFRLKVRPTASLATGPYGSEAISMSNSSINQLLIDKTQPDDVVFELQTRAGYHPDDPKTIRGQLIFEDEPPIEIFISVTKLGANGTGGGTANSGIDDLKQALGISPPGSPAASPAAVKAVRLYLRRRKTTSDAANPYLKASAWVALPVEIRGYDTKPASGLDGADALLEKRIVEAVVDEFESPRKADFIALDRASIPMTCGGIVFAQPCFDADFQTLVSSPRDAVKPVPDIKRRNGVRLTWNVQPENVRFTRPAGAGHHAAAWSLIGGFDIFQYDPVKLVHDETPSYVMEKAEFVGSLHVQPTTERGLTPHEFGEMSSIQAAYPSDTLQGEDPVVVRTPWLSLANSVPLWPAALVRRSVMPVIDFSLPNVLIANGLPDSLRVSVIYQPSVAGDTLQPPELQTANLGINGPGTTGWASVTQSDRTVINCPAWTVTIDCARAASLETIRRTLHNLQFSGVFRSGQAFEDLDDATLRRLMIRIEAIRGALPAGPQLPTPERVLVTEDISFEPHSALHPVLADALDFMRYNDVENPTYSRFDVVLDPNPEYHLEDLHTFMDSCPEGRDPHGWGALRTLGLALGFRLYDVDLQSYLTGQALLQRIQQALDRALAIYEGDIFLGAPFVDVLTRPWGSAALVSYDGGPAGSTDGQHIVENEALAAIQIALRPVSERLLKRKDFGPLRFFRLAGANSAKLSWTVAAPGVAAAQGYTVDFVGEGVSAISSRPARLEAGPPAAGPVPATELPGASCLLRLVIPNEQPSDANSLADAITIDDLRPDLHPTLKVTELQPAELYTFWTAQLAPGPEPCYALYADQDVTVQVLQPNATLISAIIEGGPAATAGTFAILAGQAAIFKLQPAPDPVPPLPPNPLPLGALTDYVTITGNHRLAELAPGLLSKFDPLEADDSGQLFFGLTLPDPDPAFANFKHWAQGALKSTAVPAVQKERNDLAAAYAIWGARFLAHGPAQFAFQSTTGFSLGTVTEQKVWRMPPDRHGNVSFFALIPDKSGSSRKFVVRPFGRYRSFIDAFKTHRGESARPSLDGALIDSDMEQYAVATAIPRTEPLARPVFLSSGLLPNGALEVVLDRPVDAVLGDANRVTEAGEDFDATYVEFVREFPWRQWAERCLGSYAMGALDNRATVPVSFIDLDAFDNAADMAALRRRVPDAWLGATVLRAHSLPYFYRIHALAYTAAGAVVSEPVVTTINEGAFDLKRPSDANDYSPQAAPARYKVLLETVTTGNPPAATLATCSVRLHISLPLLRFTDCMSRSSQRHWIPAANDAGAAQERLQFHLPEPTIVYRLSIAAKQNGAAAQNSAASPEIDALPQSAPAATEPHYVIKQSMAVLKVDCPPPLPPIVPGGPVIPVPPTVAAVHNPAELCEWRIELDAELAAAQHTVPRPGLEDLPQAALQDFTFPAGQVAAALLWSRIAPRGAATVTATKPTAAADWAVFAAEVDTAVALYQGLPGLDSLEQWLASLQPIDDEAAWIQTFPADPPALDLTIENWWSGLPVPAGPYVTVAPPAAPLWPATVPDDISWPALQRGLLSSFAASAGLLLLLLEVLLRLRAFRAAGDALRFAGIPPYRSLLETTAAKTAVDALFAQPGRPVIFDAFYPWQGTILFGGDAVALAAALTDFMAVLGEYAHTTDLLDQLDSLRQDSAGWKTGTIVFEGQLLLPARAAREPRVQAAAATLGLQPAILQPAVPQPPGPQQPGLLPALPSYLVLWQPPSDEELRPLPPEAKSLYAAAAQGQLFGEYRSLIATAIKASSNLDLDLQRDL